MSPKIGKQFLIGFLLICFGSIFGCGGGGGGGSNPPVSPAQVDMTGIWQVEEVVDGNCQGTNYPYTEIFIYTGTQEGNTLTMRDTTGNREFTATINGSTISFEDTFPDGDGTITFEFTGTCSSDGQSFSGRALWTYNESGYSCSGTTEFTGTKNSDTQVDATGSWSGTFESRVYGISDTFEAVIADDNGVLSGTISVPYIGMTNAGLTGIVEGSAITFGDIDNQITFTGTISETGAASGTYVYLSVDNGNWEATR